MRGGLKDKLQDVYVGMGDTSERDLVLVIEIDHEYFPPARSPITLTPEQIDKLEQEIKKWQHA